MLLLAMALFLMPSLRASAAPEARIAISDRSATEVVANAHILRRVEADRPVRLTFVLPLRDPQGRADLLRRLYDPSDAHYHKFLTAEEFAARFAPSITSVTAVARFAQSQGLRVEEIAANRRVLVAQGRASLVEQAFRTHLHDYAAPDGTAFRAPDSMPSLPRRMAGLLVTVAGFDTLPAARPNLRRAVRDDSLMLPMETDRSHFVNGSGPGGYLAPSDIKTAYSLNNVSASGTGQVLGLFELDGYTGSDITQYESRFFGSLPRVPLQTVPVDGYSGRAETTDGASEATLDIDMMIALAPRAAKIIVYEGDNTTAGLIAAYNRIASDDAARVVSSSWGLSEVAADFYGQVDAEGQAFEEMAMQGQTMLAASGDAGAYSDNWTLSVDDPASQPFVTGVGGTDITLSGSSVYEGESAWGDRSDTYDLRPHGQGGGGGVSIIQALPSYQIGIASASPFVSRSFRNVPDVSLYGDYDTGGYSVYITDPANPSAGGQWGGFNGTSAASPLWAGFIALVDQGRAAAGRAPIGFLNPSIYALGKNAAAFARDFHDVGNGTTNLYYPAASGYDLATGWGSMNGVNMYADLVSSGTVPSVTSYSPGTGSAGQTITVTGVGFTGASAVTIDGVSAPFAVHSDTQLTVTVPGGAKTGPIAVTDGFGTGASRTSLIITTGGALRITSVTPPDAQVGSVVTIFGSGFTGTSRVTVGGISVAYTVMADGEIVFTVPAAVRGGTVAVTAPQGTVEGLTRLAVVTWSAQSVAAVPDGTARVLWIRSDGAAGVWNLDEQNQKTLVGPIYGPYVDGQSAWNALALAAAPDGTARILWSRGDGAAGVWTINALGAVTRIGPTYGPYADGTGTWQASGIAVAPDGTPRLLWNRSDHAMGIWTLNSSDAMSDIGPTYGPFPDGQGSAWSALGIACTGAGTARVLWSRLDGAMEVWSFDASNRQSVVGPIYGPYSDGGGDWYPISLGISADDVSHVLWGRSDGAAGVWNLNASGVQTLVGEIYGPYAQYSPFGLSAAGEQSRLLWVRNDRAAGLWTLNDLNQKALIGPTYGPY